MWKHNNFINLQLCAPGPHDCTVYFDNNIISVTCTGDYGDSDTWTESGTTMSITSGATDIQYFTVILKEGYVLDNITYTESSQLQLNDVTDNSFNISGDYGQLAMVTLTSKQKTAKNYIISSSELTAIADATRTKADITTKLTPAQIAEKINNLTIVADIDTADKMAALLVAENEGNVYKYVGTTTSDYVNGDLYIVEEAPSSEETWVLNDEISMYSGQTTGEFDRALYYLSIEFETNGYNAKSLIYDERGSYTSTGAWGIGLQSVAVPSSTSSTHYMYEHGRGWTDTAFKTWVFSTAPTGDLLTWLQSNGTKQGGTTGHMLTFSGVTVKVDGTPVTSPYALTKDCTIVATANTANYEVVVTAGSIEHHTDVNGNTLALADTDINIAEANVGATKMNNITISYTAGGEVTPVGYKLTLTNIYLNAGNTVTIHMSNADGTATAANTLSTGMSWDNVVSFYITDTYGGNKIVTINGTSAAMPTEASPYTITQDTTFTFDNTCLTADMLVTLADGSEKQICELTPDDTYITYDFATGDLATAPAEYIDAINGHSGKFASQYQKYIFEDGTVIKEVNKHRFLNLRKMEFINLCHWEIGDRIYKIDGTTPALVSKETIVGEVEHFTVTTSKYHNGFVQGCLYGDRYTQKYEIKMVDGKPVYDFSKPHTVDYLYGKVPYSD
mgnify:CR=1 FL=1